MPRALALIATAVSMLALVPLVVFAGFAVSLGFRAGRLRGTKAPVRAQVSRSD